MSKELCLGELYPCRRGRGGGKIDNLKLTFALRKKEQQRRIEEENKKERQQKR